ncbi:MAG: bifunctional phosphopantothenoylcysteine decarboxylase/phosphopantothenate--cysteine ligase CoaBC, partial [Opitutales bacterium]|nr:bifunctional phosphopantothenoylcysteine decarboxylase/phosphopantothenate--cysteine ligase CoaBC [Opitutales bacterium]
MKKAKYYRRYVFKLCDTKLFNGRNIVLGVSGGIAAYKAVEVVSRLKKLGAEVDVIMTGNAMKFVAPHTFGTISRRPVTTGMFNENFQWDVKHISLARKADIIVVVPATANIIGKIANGIADDMLSTTIMAAKCNTIFVPAMNTKMYTNAIVQKNIKTLKENGYLLMDPSEGILACGEMGTGRAPEPVEVVEKIKKEIFKGNDFKGLNILITAG